MIYITGDTHGRHDFAKLVYFAEAHPELTKKDQVIVAGDFGGVWSEQSLETMRSMYARLPFTTLFVDGNHENFDMLDAYPVEIWNGGKVHKISPDVIHLMRGQVFEIEGKTFFTFGGATSVDRFLRTEGISWWPQELPNYEQFDEAIANLKRYNNKVDYIVTHSCDEKALWYPPLCNRTRKTGVYPENLLLSAFEDAVQYRHWYFGHYHIDADLRPDKTALYQKIIPLDRDEKEKKG